MHTVHSNHPLYCRNCFSDADYAVLLAWNYSWKDVMSLNSDPVYVWMQTSLSETVIKCNLLKARPGSCCLHDPHSHRMSSQRSFSQISLLLLLNLNITMFYCSREQVVEKKYPGMYKRHLARPIVRPNAVEKLIKKKSSVNQKPGTQQPKRWRYTACVLFVVSIIIYLIV